MTARHRVRNKQPNSTMCLVCGLNNPAGLHSSFFELDNGELLALFRPRIEHQGYPGRLHGGLAATILDETIGRAIMIEERGTIWGVSVELTTRFTSSTTNPSRINDARRLFTRRSSEA